MTGLRVEYPCNQQSGCELRVENSGAGGRMNIGGPDDAQDEAADAVNSAR
jgi:hypothetical protein